MKKILNVLINFYQEITLFILSLVFAGFLAYGNNTLYCIGLTYFAICAIVPWIYIPINYFQTKAKWKKETDYLIARIDEPESFKKLMTMLDY